MWQNFKQFRQKINNKMEPVALHAHHMCVIGLSVHSCCMRGPMRESFTSSHFRQMLSTRHPQISFIPAERFIDGATITNHTMWPDTQRISRWFRIHTQSQRQTLIYHFTQGQTRSDHQVISGTSPAPNMYRPRKRGQTTRRCDQEHVALGTWRPHSTRNRQGRQLYRSRMVLITI